MGQTPFYMTLVKRAIFVIWPFLHHVHRALSREWPFLHGAEDSSENGNYELVLHTDWVDSEINGTRYKYIATNTQGKRINDNIFELSLLCYCLVLYLISE